MKSKFKRFETLLKSMQTEVCEDRPDCCDVIAMKDEWIMSLDDIQESAEFREFVNQLNNNSNTDDSIVKYAKYHFNSEARRD